MRKFVIDTDTASDDAIAIMLALLSQEVDILGITTVCGNISLESATKNALMTKEICGSKVEVYKGCEKPLFKERSQTACVHGIDGMGDMDLIHPKTKENGKHAVDYIIETVNKYANEVEIVALGPVTNIALAILKEPATMKKVKKIWSMGTSGFGHGNATPVAEFNVYIDAESYKIMLNSKIPITIIGFDMCLGESAINKSELDLMLQSTDISKFAAQCTTELLKFNLNKPDGKHQVDLPDAVAMAVAIWNDITLDKAECNCYCCTLEPATYGQVIIADSCIEYEAIGIDYKNTNATVIKKIDTALFKTKLLSLLCK